MAAERKHDQAIMNLQRECETLEKCCNETNERRVSNRLKDVYCCWDALEKCQGDYVSSIEVTVVHEDHIDDLTDSYQRKEKVIMMAEDYIWKAERERRAEEEGSLTRIKNEKYRATMSKMKEVVMQDVADLKVTEESIMRKIGPQTDVHIEAIKFMYEKYCYEFKKLTNDFKSYANEEINQALLDELSTTFTDEKRTFVKNELDILSFIASHKTPQTTTVETNATHNDRVRVQRLAPPRFSGSIKDYASFKRDYKAIMEKSGYDKTHLSYQLKAESLPDVARNVVKNIVDYDEIWKRLDERFGDVGELVSVVLRDISLMKLVQDDDDKAIIDLADKVEGGYQDLKCIGKELELANVVTIKTIEAKLPKSILREWWKYSEKYDDYTGADTNVLKFRDIVTFLSDERSKARKSLRVEAERNPPYRRKELIYKIGTGSTMMYQHCWLDGCGEDHKTRACLRFKGLNIDERGKAVLNAGACVFCLELHDVKECPMRRFWNPCDRNGCGKYHSRLLHGCSTPGLNMFMQAGSTCSLFGMMDSHGSVMLLVEDVSIQNGLSAKVFWDSGSTTVLIKHEFARRERLQFIPVTYTLTTVGGEIKEYDTNLYYVKLVDRKGRIHQIKGYGIEEISTEIKSLNIDGLTHSFPLLKEDDIRRKPGSIDILIGMEYASLHPWKIKTVNNLILYQSLFGTGKIIGGWSHEVAHKKCIESNINVVAACRVRNIKLRNQPQPDFFTSEQFGVAVMPRCSTCKSCKDCSFETTQLTYLEQQELKVIQKNLTLDAEKGRWITKYPWKDDPGLLENNYMQVYKMLCSTERRLMKSGGETMKLFNDQIQDFINRKVLRLLTPEEIQEWNGPVHYLATHEVYKDDLHATTPVRLVVNSALKYKGRSLNSMLMKGPSSLNDLYSILVRFRGYPVALVGDISKMYQTIDVTPVEQHTRRILWRRGDVVREPDIYVLTTVTYGDVCAGSISAAALKNTAQVFKGINVEASEKLINDDTYVDDVMTGGNTHEEVDKLRDDMILIGKKGGFNFKEWTISGEKNECIDVLGSGEFSRVLGCLWNTEDDVWRFKEKVNYFGKHKGSRKGPDLSREEIRECLPRMITKRIVLRLVNTVYDPLGLIVPFTIKLKLEMRKIYLGENKLLDWDDPIPEDMRNRWVELLLEMFEMQDVKFRHCIKPDDVDPEALPILVTFSDASSIAFCACSYIQWRRLNGEHATYLVSAKARIGPINKISIPRMELQGAVMNCRLHNAVRNALGLKYRKEAHIIDSGAVMGMINHESTACKEFVGTRVGEIRGRSDIKTWEWVQSKENPADLGTHGSTPLKIDEDSRWQNGPEWMKLDMKHWPIDHHYEETMPSEELVQINNVNMVSGDQNNEAVINIQRFNSVHQLINVTAIVMKIVKERTFKVTDLTVQDLKEAEGYWERDVMKASVQAFNKGNLRSLRAMKREDGMIVVSGRANKLLSIGYDAESLMILMPQHKYSRLYLKMIHEGSSGMEHDGVLTDLSKSREKYWIPQAKRILTHIRLNCFKCKLKAKILERQIMAPLPESRIKPSPVWYTTSLDLFGPLKIVDAVKRRTTGKCWGLIASCTVTRCVHLDITENYGTDSMLMTLRRFVAERGCVAEFQSDKGSQMVASSKEMTGEVSKWTWNDDLFHSWAKSKRIEWNFSPVGAPHMNGCSEALIRVTKTKLNDVLKGSKFTFGELMTIVKEIQQLINSRPIGLAASDKDPTAGGLLTCNHLLMGRATSKIPQGPFTSTKSLTKRFRFIQTVVDDWWKKWIVSVFPTLVPSYRWHKRYRDVCIGDIVLMKEESLVRGEYKIGRICEVKLGRDNHVRKVIVEYKVCDGSLNRFPKDFKQSERAIHNLCVIVPAGYKNEDVEDDMFYMN